MSDRQMNDPEPRGESFSHEGSFALRRKELSVPKPGAMIFGLSYRPWSDDTSIVRSL